MLLKIRFRQRKYFFKGKGEIPREIMAIGIMTRLMEKDKSYFILPDEFFDN
jgi:hypothetical protein